MGGQNDATFQATVQQLHHLMVLLVRLRRVLGWAEKVAETEHKVELAVLRVNGLDFRKELAEGADR